MSRKLLPQSNTEKQPASSASSARPESMSEPAHTTDMSESAHLEAQLDQLKSDIRELTASMSEIGEQKTVDFRRESATLGTEEKSSSEVNFALDVETIKLLQGLFGVSDTAIAEGISKSISLLALAMKTEKAGGTVLFMDSKKNLRKIDLS